MKCVMFSMTILMLSWTCDKTGNDSSLLIELAAKHCAHWSIIYGSECSGVKFEARNWEQIPLRAQRNFFSGIRDDKIAITDTQLSDKATLDNPEKHFLGKNSRKISKFFLQKNHLLSFFRGDQRQ